MREVMVLGQRLGHGAPKTVVSLMGGDAEELVAQARKATAAGADCLEWRVDFLRDLSSIAPTAHALCEAAGVAPLIGTVRTAGQGGNLELAPEAYVELCGTLAQSKGADILDVELDKGDDVVRDLVQMAHALRKRTIVSYHDFAQTPPARQMVELLEHMVELGADLPKLAVMAHDQADCLRLMEASAHVREELGVPTVAIAMGPHGMLSRLAGQACGSALTFCALGQASAPGQVELAQARGVIAALHAALGETGDGS